nr:MAG TPA: hypothetical protein [Caudoviricetes sp.]
MTRHPLDVLSIIFPPEEIQDSNEAGRNAGFFRV